jgi:hypothetical protein
VEWSTLIHRIGVHHPTLTALVGHTLKFHGPTVGYHRVWFPLFTDSCALGSRDMKHPRSGVRKKSEGSLRSVHGANQMPVSPEKCILNFPYKGTIYCNPQRSALLWLFPECIVFFASSWYSQKKEQKQKRQREVKCWCPCGGSNACLSVSPVTGHQCNWVAPFSQYYLWLGTRPP